MKRTLLILGISLIFASVSGQTVGQLDDFDGTLHSWFEPGASPNPPVLAPNQGPAGAGDTCMEDASSGGGGAGSRMVVRNVSQWTGNFLSNGINYIKFDARAEVADLDFRIAMDGGGGRISSNNFVTGTAGGGWVSVVIPINVGNFTTVGGSDVATTLDDANEMRILSNPNPSYIGENINAVMYIDNIEAVDVLSNEEFEVQNSFQLRPNPARSFVNLRVYGSSANAKIEVFDVLGKRILTQTVSALEESKINVSNWNDGVYLVRVTTDKGSDTKRFIKQ